MTITWHNSFRIILSFAESYNERIEHTGIGSFSEHNLAFVAYVRENVQLIFLCLYNLADKTTITDDFST